MKKRFEKIYVEITNICNLKCNFCIETMRKKEYMSIEKFKIVISKIREYTNLIALHIKGEPLLHPKLKEILDICYDNNILVNITTNTTLLEQNLEILASSKAVRQINLSIHAIMENNLDMIENVKRIFNQIKKLKEKNNAVIISYRLWNIDAIELNQKNEKILEEIGEEYKITNIVDRSKKEKFIQLDDKIFLNQDIEFSWPSLKENKISDTRKVLCTKKASRNFSKWGCSTMLFR